MHRRFAMPFFFLLRWLRANDMKLVYTTGEWQNVEQIGKTGSRSCSLRMTASRKAEVSDSRQVRERSMPFISVVSGCFNEAENIPELYERVVRAFEDTLAHYNFELMIIDNASTDGTVAVLKKI